MNLAQKIPKSLLKTLHSTASKPTRHLHPCGTPSSPDSDSGGEKIPLIPRKVDTFRFNKVRYNLFNGNSSSGGSTFYRSSGARNNFLCPWTCCSVRGKKGSLSGLFPLSIKRSNPPRDPARFVSLHRGAALPKISLYLNLVLRPVQSFKGCWRYATSTAPSEVVIFRGETGRKLRNWTSLNWTDKYMLESTFNEEKDEMMSPLVNQARKVTLY